MRRELEQLRSQQNTDYAMPASESSLEQDGERQSTRMAAPASSHDFDLKCNGAVSLDGTMLSSSLAVDALKLYVVFFTRTWADLKTSKLMSPCYLGLQTYSFLNFQLLAPSRQQTCTRGGICYSGRYW